MNPMHTLRNSLRPFRRNHRSPLCLVALLIINAAAMALADDPSKAAADRPATGRYADHEQLVAETHKASLKLRE